jgi:hypothetical protein
VPALHRRRTRRHIPSFGHKRQGVAQGGVSVAEGTCISSASRAQHSGRRWPGRGAGFHRRHALERRQRDVAPAAPTCSATSPSLRSGSKSTTDNRMANVSPFRISLRYHGSDRCCVAGMAPLSYTAHRLCPWAYRTESTWQYQSVCIAPHAFKVAPL